MQQVNGGTGGEKIRRGTEDEQNCKEMLSFNSCLQVNSNIDSYFNTIFICDGII